MILSPDSGILSSDSTILSPDLTIRQPLIQRSCPRIVKSDEFVISRTSKDLPRPTGFFKDTPAAAGGGRRMFVVGPADQR